MRLIVSVFLTLFAVDGCISLLDEVVSMMSAAPVVSGVRLLVANAVFFMAVAIYCIIAVDDRLPKRIFLPPTLFLFGSFLVVTLFPHQAGHPTFGLSIAIMQVLLSIVVFSTIKRSNGSLLLPETLFAKPIFNLKSTLRFGAVNLTVIPIVLLLLGFASARAFFEEYAAGFVRLAPGGLHMTEKVYWRNGKTVRLAAMIHVGEKQYFDQLSASLRPGRTIVLMEGVTDDDHLLQNKPDYGKVADLFGLVTQEKLQFDGRLIEEDELDNIPVPPSGGAGKATEETVDLLRADVDLRTFRPQTISFLDMAARQMNQSRSLLQALLSINDSSWGPVTPELEKALLDDILYSRNRELIRYLKKSIDRYDTIVIPWGALHMPEVEAEVFKMGFRLQQQHERISIDLFRSLKEIVGV